MVCFAIQKKVCCVSQVSLKSIEFLQKNLTTLIIQLQM